MFSNITLKPFRILLLPVSLVYFVVIFLRNWLYNSNIFKSTSFGLPVICVGNLAVGGTGKSPMVEYLVREFKNEYRVATLSRGYKRKTKGYALADEGSTALDIGDEPMQFHLKFPDVPVAVGEERIVAIAQLLHDKPDTEVIILDDAFQHRAIKAGLNILLTDYNNLFTRDYYLPAGELRDLKSNYKRADIIVVTKCGLLLTDAAKSTIIKEINPIEGQEIYFTAIRYGDPYHISNSSPFFLTKDTEVLLVTGIANPRAIEKKLEETCSRYILQQYPDHYIFSIDDLKKIRMQFESLQSANKIILTTEKDAVRLVKFKDEIENLPVYVIPVRHQFLFDGEDSFNKQVSGFINNFKRNN